MYGKWTELLLHCTTICELEKIYNVTIFPEKNPWPIVKLINVAKGMLYYNMK